MVYAQTLAVGIHLGGVDSIGDELGDIVDLAKHDTKQFVELDLEAENQYIRQNTKLPLIITFY